jgi:hypothetical protein
MEATFIAQLWSGIEAFFTSINWLFVVIFIIIMWLMNEGTDSKNTFSWLDWLQPIPKAWRTFIGGLLLATVFAFFYDIKAKADYAGLLYSVLIGMVIWKLGINSVFEWFKQKVWLTNPPENKTTRTPTA